MEEETVRALENALFVAIKVVTCFMLVVTVVLVCGDVFLRYVMNRSLGWSEELLRYLLIWMTFLGCYLAAREGRHLGIELFFRWFPATWQTRITRAADLLLVVFFGIFTVLSAQYAWKFVDDTGTTVEISMGLVYAAMPVGGLLILFQTLRSMRKGSR
jgi:TRAP-type C4-dicarboxylate transport system permease small subunit